MENIIKEKFIVANYLKELSYDGKRYRRNLEDFLPWLITSDEKNSLSYEQYNFLRGSDEEYISFIREELGIDESDDESIFNKYYDSIKGNYDFAVKQGNFGRKK